MWFRAFQFAAAICLLSQPAFAESLAYEVQRVCGNDGPCKAVSLSADIVEVRESLLVSLGDEAPVVLTAYEVTHDLILRGTGTRAKDATSFMLTVFADLSLVYSTHSFVGQGVALTLLGSCQRNKV